MTVAELIAELQKFPPDRTVAITTGEYPYDVPVVAVGLHEGQETDQRYPWCEVHGFLAESDKRGELCALCYPMKNVLDDTAIVWLRYKHKPLASDKWDVMIEG